MNLSRISLSVLLFLFAFTAANGQKCADFFPQKEGAVLKHVTYDKKGKVSGSSEMAYKEKWADKLLELAEQFIPGLREHAQIKIVNLIPIRLRWEWKRC